MKYPGPIITISEVNWCFRAVFDLSEIDYTRFYILVQSTTDNIVFRDQFDRQENQFFVCIDIFIKPTPVKEEPQIIRVEKSSDGDKDMSGETDGDSQREIDGLIVIATLIAVVLLLVILYKVKNAIARKQSEVSTTRSNRPPPEFVELSIINNQNTTGI